MNIFDMNLSEDIDYFPANHPMNKGHRTFVFVIDLQNVPKDFMEKMKEKIKNPLVQLNKDIGGKMFLCDECFQKLPYKEEWCVGCLGTHICEICCKEVDCFTEPYHNVPPSRLPVDMQTKQSDSL